MNTERIFGQESWRLRTRSVDAAVTVNGGMMGPVAFILPNDRRVSPYYVNPWWAEENSTVEPAVLKPLRGDFFCLPFAGGTGETGDVHEPHGESAYAPWRIVPQTGAHVPTGEAGGPNKKAAEAAEPSGGGTRDGLRNGDPLAGNRPDGTTLTLEIDYSAVPAGRIVKELTALRDHPTILTSHTITGFNGSYPLGHHATLQGALPGEDAAEPIWKIQIPPFDLGMTTPSHGPASRDAEYYALPPGERFTTLESVPTRWKDPATTDCSLFPARPGFIDILGIYRRPRSGGAPASRGGALTTGDTVAAITWTAAVNLRENYVWFSLKRVDQLPATVLWMENRGRHGHPWAGRNSCIGIEETCTHFADGVAASIDGGVPAADGIATTLRLSPDAPTEVRTAQGVFAVVSPEVRLDRLEIGESCETGEECIVFVDTEGHRYPTGVPVTWFG